MLKTIKRCALFFIFFIVFSDCRYAFAEQVSSFDLEEIVVSKGDIHLLNTYTLESDTLKELPLSSPTEALSFLPLDLQSRSLKGGIQTDFSLRGSNYQGVLVLIDGQRINDPQTGHHHSDIPLTTKDIQRIEVIPGVSSSIFGPDAMGGAVNIVLKKPREKNRVLETSFGQYQTKSGLFSMSEKNDIGGVRFSLENQESDGFYEDTDFKKFTATLNSFLEITDGEANFSWGYQEKEFGAYDFYTPASGYLSKEWTKTFLLNTGLKINKGSLMIKPNFLWRRHFDKFMLDKTQSRSRSLNHHRTDMYTPNIYLQKENALLGKAGLGLEYGEERINSTNIGKYNRNHQSIFMDNSKDLNSKLSLGNSFRIDDYDGFNTAYSGSLSFRYKISDRDALHLGISRSIRVPCFTELYYSDSTTIGNSSLSEEKTLNYQLGYDYKKAESSIGITFFFKEDEDMIDWIKRTPTQARWQSENITEAEVKGIESYLKLKINADLNLDFNYTYIDKRINDQGYLYKYGENYIRHLFNNILRLDLPFGVQTISFTYKQKPTRDGWSLLNTHFSYHLNKHSQIFLNITNLFNVEYQEIKGIPQPGRGIEAGLSIEW